MLNYLVRYRPQNDIDNIYLLSKERRRRRLNCLALTDSLMVTFFLDNNFDGEDDHTRTRSPCVSDDEHDKQDTSPEELC
jgi:hypothetical protein